MATNVWKKWEKDMAKWVIQYLVPWQKANPGVDWVTELYNEQQAAEKKTGGLHPPPPPPIP